ncbi:MAG: N-acetyl sugar amidotransferase, partial [Alphaproteobacteria bacterium]|nr:N-acetyl sugar amidotransferase [Alphaproteobacteria bacterium]
QIRYGMTSRDEAIATLAATGLQVPHEDIKRFCTFVGESEDWFWATAESFRNLDIWTFLNGQWTIPGFLISDWDWGH